MLINLYIYSSFLISIFLIFPFISMFKDREFIFIFITYFISYFLVSVQEIKIFADLKDLKIEHLA